MTGPRHSPTHQGERNDIENPAGESPADWHRPPGADRLHIRADIGGGGIANPADPSGIGAGLVPAPIRPGESLATPIISANGMPVGESLPGTVFLRDFMPGTYTFTVPSYGVDFGQAATVQLAAGTQIYLEVQSLRSWAGAGGDNFQRDTLYVRAISPYWAEKYFPTLKYLGQG